MLKRTLNIIIDGKKQIILYVASSLDGFIVRTNDWLLTDQDYGYRDFYEIIGTIIMGNTTCQQVLSFGEFPYIYIKRIFF